MPARKPKTLITRSETKADQSARESGEASVTPRTELTVAIPPILRGHAKAQRTWKRLVNLYREVDGTIATAFDADMLIDYCLLLEELDELALMRKKIKNDLETHRKHAQKIKPNAENLKEYNALWEIVNAIQQKFQGFDARLDGKRKLAHTLRQSLYLTPRSRAGVAPPEKPKEEPKSEMEKILDS